MQLKMLVYIATTNVILHWIQNTYGFVYRKDKPRGNASRKQA